MWHTWEAQVRTLLPEVRVTRIRVLAACVRGLLGAGQVSLLRVAATLPLAAADVSIERRLQRWLTNRAVSQETMGTPRLPAVRAGQAGQELVLVFDPTPQTTCATILVLGLVAHKRGLPLAWQVVPQRDPWPERMGQS